MSKFIICSTLVFCMSCYTNPIFAEIVPAHVCNDLHCVRVHIDEIDKQLVDLLGQRLALVKRAGELKKGLPTVHDQTRENKILADVDAQAQIKKYPVQIIHNIFKFILAEANRYETEIQQHYQQQGN